MEKRRYAQIKQSRLTQTEPAAQGEAEDAVGEFTIPPIRVYTGTKWQETPELRLEVFKDLEGENMGFLEITPSATRVYVHEPLSFIVDFGVNDGLEILEESIRTTRYLDIQVQAPWLSDLEAGEPLAVDDPQRPFPVVLNRSLQLAEVQEGHERDGRVYNRFLFEKAFLPNRLGRFELDAPVMVASVRVRRRVGLFGEVLPGGVEQFPVYGEPLTIEVLPIPDEGRPVPYFGAVGRFQIAASLDQDRVRVGNSLKLKLAITGTGNFGFLRVPELDLLGGFHLLGKTQNRESGQLEVTYDLTPLDASVTELLPRPLPEYDGGDYDYSDLEDDARWRSLTPRILLTHTSGFANFRWLETDQRLRFHHDPGSRYGYSGETSR